MQRWIRRAGLIGMVDIFYPSYPPLKGEEPDFIVLFLPFQGEVEGRH